MHKLRRNEAGDSLIEILVSLVMIGLLVGALLSAYATAARGSNSERDFVTADAVLRDYAERTKAAVRTSCPNAATYTVTYPAPPRFVTLSPLPGSPQPCPSSTTTVQQVHLTVAMPHVGPQSLDIIVRTP
jgi:type II secretory pathway pseudopilin PulG